MNHCLYEVNGILNFQCLSSCIPLLRKSFSYVPRLLTETVRQSQEAWGGLKDWTEVEVIYNYHIFHYFIDFHV